MEVQTEPLKENPYVEYYRQVHQTQTGLLNLAEELGNMSKASQVMGMSRDTF